jgi:monoamine oxidase
VSKSDVEVVVVGGGAAGIAAAKRLRQSAIDCLLVEARPRLGGRAWTITDGSGYGLDLGCGWLHSADRNPWARVAQEQGTPIEKTPPPWMRPALALGFTAAQQSDFRQAFSLFFTRVEEAAQRETDMAASALLEPGCRWNGLINAMSTYIAGVELDRLSVKDFDRYEDSGINWRVVEGFGTLISRYGADLATELDCEVRRIDHGGKRLRIETSKGAIAADRAIVAVPTTILATERIQFAPAMPAKVEAARGLPLGLDDKLFMSLEKADEFASDIRLFGHIDRAATAGYHIRPFGRPMIEAYFGGKCATDLEAQGEAAFFDFAVVELTGILGSDFAMRVKPIRVHRWGHDPFALGSYSCALPGFADCRDVLAEPVDDRLFFAGEACSRHDFSTAHGGFNTGVAAADAIIAARRAQT